MMDIIVNLIATIVVTGGICAICYTFLRFIDFNKELNKSLTDIYKEVYEEGLEEAI